MVGNFSGRNAGDAAILGCLLDDVHALYPGAAFDVPTINPAFVARQYARFPVRPVGMLPWNLSVKIFGLPILRSVLRADLVLVTDAILFDLKLWNPLFNYLSTMALVLPLARRRGIPVVLYNVSLGPVKTAAGVRCLRRVLDASAKVIVRDRESVELLERLGWATAGVLQGADCALNVRPTAGEALQAIRRRLGLDAPFVTFNINSYLDVFVRGGGPAVDRAAFTRLMAETADRVIREFGVRVLFVVTQPMDGVITSEVTAQVRAQDRIGLAVNPDYTYEDLAAIFSLARLHVGMRTHSLILSTAVGTPVVGLMATPKNRGYMRSIEQDARMVEFEGLTAERLWAVVADAWRGREAIAADLRRIVAREQAKARGSARELAPWLASSQGLAGETRRAG